MYLVNVLSYIPPLAIYFCSALAKIYIILQFLWLFCRDWMCIKYKTLEKKRFIMKTFPLCEPSFEFSFCLKQHESWMIMCLSYFALIMHILWWDYCARIHWDVDAETIYCAALVHTMCCLTMLVSKSVHSCPKLFQSQPSEGRGDAIIRLCVGKAVHIFRQSLLEVLLTFVHIKSDRLKVT